MSELTQKELKELLHYDPNTGIFTWLKYMSRTARVGHKAGSINHNGYIQIYIQRKCYGAHQLALLYMTGVFPKEHVDHENQIRNDNRFINLRFATRSNNMANRHALRTNKLGIKGVSLKRGGGLKSIRYVAQITKNNKKYHLGYYDTVEEAKQAYDLVAIKLHGEFAGGLDHA